MQATNCAVQLSAQGYVPHTELYSGLWTNVCLGGPFEIPTVLYPHPARKKNCMIYHPSRRSLFRVNIYL